MTEQPYIERHPPKAETLPRSVFNTLEELEEALKETREWGGSWVENADFSKLDFTCSKGQELLAQINRYDDKTTWPKNLQSEMIARLESGKNSGLGIDSVHQRGYTGKGINIAIIDQCCFLEHPEYKDNIKYYKEFGMQEFQKKFGILPSNGVSQYHGPAVASLAVGTNCGSGPDAGLYFLATQDHDKKEGQKQFDPSNRLKAIRHLIELNNSLSEKDKIRCVSCSWGDGDTPDYEERMQLFKELEDTGCMVFGGCYGCIFQTVGGRKIDRNSNAKDNLVADSNSEQETRLIIPRHQRTFASQMGGYWYTETGGQSWMPPYLAGLVACGLQACPDYTKQKDWQHKIWQDLLDTALQTPNNRGKIIQPVAFIDKMVQYQKERLQRNNILSDILSKNM